MTYGSTLTCRAKAFLPKGYHTDVFLGGRLIQALRKTMDTSEGKTNEGKTKNVFLDILFVLLIVLCVTAVIFTPSKTQETGYVQAATATLPSYPDMPIWATGTALPPTALPSPTPRPTTQLIPVDPNTIITESGWYKIGFANADTNEFVFIALYCQKGELDVDGTSCQLASARLLTSNTIVTVKINQAWPQQESVILDKQGDILMTLYYWAGYKIRTGKGWKVISIEEGGP